VAEPKLRAVLDTSVLVSAVLKPDGPSGQVLRASGRNAFVLVTSPAILNELVEVLSRPKLQKQTGLGFEEVAQIRVGLQKHAETVAEEYRDLDLVPTDPDDNPVAATALEAQADYLVTLDGGDLLSLKVILKPAHHPIQIVMPTAFLMLLGQPRR
jgi:uncharacterized protein